MFMINKDSKHNETTTSWTYIPPDIELHTFFPYFDFKTRVKCIYGYIFQWCVGQEKQWQTKLKKLVFIPIVLLPMLCLIIWLTKNSHTGDEFNTPIGSRENATDQYPGLISFTKETEPRRTKRHAFRHSDKILRHLLRRCDIFHRLLLYYKYDYSQNIPWHSVQSNSRVNEYPDYLEEIQNEHISREHRLRNNYFGYWIKQCSLASYTFDKEMSRKMQYRNRLFRDKDKEYDNKEDIAKIRVRKHIFSSVNETKEQFRDYLGEDQRRRFEIHRQKDFSEIRDLQSKVMRKYMNQSADPCHNFYEYSCGNWKKYHAVPPDKEMYDTFEMARENLDHILKEIIENIQGTNNNDSLSAEKYQNDATIKVKHFYKSCLNIDEINQKGDKSLRKVLEELGGWPIISKHWDNTQFDILSLLSKLKLLNNDILIAQWIGPDIKNSHKYIIHIDQTTLGLPAKEYYLESNNAKYIKAYKSFIFTVASLLGAEVNVSLTDTEDLIKFETQLAEITASLRERLNISEIYLRTNIYNLSGYFPGFDWRRYFSIVLGKDVNLDTTVACYCSQYIPKLLDLLARTNPRIIQNYVLWRFVKHRTSNLGNRFLEAKLKFYSTLFGREKQPSRWQFCVAQTNSFMGMALGSLFVKKYFDKTSRTDTTEMTKNVGKAFGATLLEKSWLDNETKTFAHMKLNKMGLKIGFPDYVLNKTELNLTYEDIKISPTNFFENIIVLLEFFNKEERKKMGTFVDKAHWNTPPAVVNAYYSRNKNQIMFPAGILQPPFYHKHFPKALNFGGIGVIIGHEIAHGLDDKGRLFDHMGNLYSWWKEPSIEKFYEKAQCMIDQYSRYILPDIKLPLNGLLTQGENIADNGGLKQAFRAYMTWLEENADADETLPDLDLNGKQLFFLNFAQVWCGKQRNEAAKSRIKTSVHSPGMFRVIGVLSNSEEFSEVYNCPKDSPMNPEFKCVIW